MTLARVGRHPRSAGPLTGLIVACQRGCQSAALFLVLPISLAAGQARKAQAAHETVTAFVNVSVIPMDRDQVLPGQTVLVRGDRITALGPTAEVRLPAGAVRIDGAGKFLLPGLADMHLHLPQHDSTPAAVTAAERALFAALAHGITTVRNMDGRSWHLALRARAARGELLSPRIYTAGPIVRADSVTAESVGRLVAEQQAAGYDFMKVYNGAWTPDVFDTLMAAAKRARFPVSGHVPWLDSAGVDRALAVPYRSMEHLHGYLPYLAGGVDSLRLAPKDSSWQPNEARLRRIAEATRRAGVWNVPTLAVLYGFGDRWYHEIEARIVRALRDAGAGLLLGTDSGVCGHESWQAGLVERHDAGPWQIGFAPRHELEMLVAAGLTPYEALAAGTRNVAEFWGTQDSTGTIAVGKRADLVLLDHNPLQTFAGLTRPAGVMLGGHWLPRSELDMHLAALGITELGLGKCLYR